MFDDNSANFQPILFYALYALVFAEQLQTDGVTRSQVSREIYIYILLKYCCM